MKDEVIPTQSSLQRRAYVALYIRATRNFLMRSSRGISAIKERAASWQPDYYARCDANHALRRTN